MSSSSYTPNLGLCAWASTDRPKHIDFVNDNAIIDEKLGEHLSNTGIHVTAEEKARYTNPHTIVSYTGDGAVTKTFTLSDSYTFALVFQKSCPPVKIDDNNNLVVHFAIVGRTIGSSSTMTMNSTSITVVQDSTATDGVKNNFNENGGQYVMLLFK
ncbi:MAG: hypothetical protein IJO20_05725 [Ruminococcus sp.]|nr:hypothetical protein [Ruminococcus sp.]MBQ7133978.1 hypothetical protein [Ruminococcus sp.]